MAVDDREVGDERADALGQGLPIFVAELRGAEVRLRLEGTDPVAASEQREQVVRVVEVEGQRVLLGPLAGEDRGHGVGGPLVHRGRVPVPGRVACEVGEARVADRVDLAPAVHERHGRELVEDDHHHRCPGRHLGEAGLRRAREDEPGGGGGEEEEREEQDGGGAEDAQEHARRTGPRVEQGGEGAGGRRGRQQRLVGGVPRVDGAEAHERDEAGDEHEMGRRGGARMHEPREHVHREEDKGRHDRDAEREEEDVPATRSAHGEELGVA